MLKAMERSQVIRSPGWHGDAVAAGGSLPRAPSGQGRDASDIRKDGRELNHDLSTTNGGFSK